MECRLRAQVNRLIFYAINIGVITRYGAFASFGVLWHRMHFCSAADIVVLVLVRNNTISFLLPEFIMCAPELDQGSRPVVFCDLWDSRRLYVPLSTDRNCWSQRSTVYANSLLARWVYSSDSKLWEKCITRLMRNDLVWMPGRASGIMIPATRFICRHFKWLHLHRQSLR